MTQEEKINLVQGLCFDLRRKMLENVKYTPETWEGLELRWWLVDSAKRFTGKIDKKRKRSYNNDMQINPNL